MTCLVARESIQLDLDGRLGGAERSALSAHLEGCAACRAYQAEMAALSARLSAEASRDARVVAPDDLMARLGLLDEAPVLAAAPLPVRRPAWRRWLPAGVAAAALVVALGVGQLTRPVEVATVNDSLSDAEAIHLWLDPEAGMVSWVGEE